MVIAALVIVAILVKRRMAKEKKELEKKLKALKIETRHGEFKRSYKIADISNETPQLKKLDRVLKYFDILKGHH